MQRASAAASSIAHSINGDEGGGKNRAEPREFIKKSNRALEKSRSERSVRIKKKKDRVFRSNYLGADNFV